MHIQIKHRYTEALIHEGDYVSTLDALSAALKSGANLRGADLSGANLRGADLSGVNLTRTNLRGANLTRTDLTGANLSGVNLRGADLRGASLSGASLSGADLRGADLSGADLSGVNLTGADLSGGNLTGANLSGANLSGANLRGADLSGVNLGGAHLSGANLRGADLRGAINGDLVVAQTRILPEGDLIGYKKCSGSTIVKLKIPANAKRSHAFGRKCRAEYVEVLEVFGAESATSLHDGKAKYETGKIVRCDKWSENWQEECAGGIHFFITRLEAENY